MIVLLTALAFTSTGREFMRFKVIALSAGGVGPVAVPLGVNEFITDESNLRLFDITQSDNKVPVPSQLEAGSPGRIWFMFDHAQGDRIFTVEQSDLEPTEGSSRLIRYPQSTVMAHGSRELVAYNHAEMMPPTGVNPAYRRSAFIHPLRSPSGEILTRIQPPDHYHHYGIWNPWTKTIINGREIDFWNLVKEEGTVRFSGYLEQNQGVLYSGIKTHHTHIYFEQDSEHLAINEVWDVRLWDLGLSDAYLLDLTVSLNTPLANGIVMDAYRYGGGLGFRATERWHRESSTVLTSEGKHRADADGEGARWMIVEGVSDFGRSGILFMSHPGNRMHPEPIRVWPEDANNGRGDLMIDISPIRNQSWRLDPGRTYTLKYRMLVFDGNLPFSVAESYWNAFGFLPTIEIL